MCCDSAHKTLPAITGAAYLHISKSAPAFFAQSAKEAMALFGSTSPSYLILQSLDRLNAHLCDSYKIKLSECVRRIEVMKERLTLGGYSLMGDEPIKLSIDTKAYGYTGEELSAVLESNGIFCEFSDKDNLVLMLSPNNSDEDMDKIENALLSIPKKEPIISQPPEYKQPEKAMSVRKAMLSPSENLPIDKCIGRTLTAPTVSCPPAVPIVVSGEIIDGNALERFKYYGIEKCSVVI